jgi:hypothetical protein
LIELFLYYQHTVLWHSLKEGFWTSRSCLSMSPAQPTKFELVINLKTAKALDLKVPPQPRIRGRCDRMIIANRAVHESASGPRPTFFSCIARSALSGRAETVYEFAYRTAGSQPLALITGAAFGEVRFDKS